MIVVKVQDGQYVSTTSTTTMAQRTSIDASGPANSLHNRGAPSEGLPAKEPLPAYDTVSIAPPDYASQRAPTIVDVDSTFEMRWTRSPGRREQTRRFVNNPRPEEAFHSTRGTPNTTTNNQQRDPEAHVHNPRDAEFSRAAFLELCVRILSWTAAAAAVASAIYVSVLVESLRQVAAIGQLAVSFKSSLIRSVDKIVADDRQALIPCVLDSMKIFNLTAANYLTKPSSGRLWYVNLIMTALSGVACYWLWRLGVRHGVFDPFGRVNGVTVAIAFMATSG